MAAPTISANISTAQTLRQFIASFEGGTINSSSENPSGKIIPDDATDVNVIWDGDSYYIAYKNSVGSYVIDDITDYLPITITPKTSTTA